MTRPGPLAGKWGPALGVVRLEQPRPFVIRVQSEEDVKDAMAAWSLLARLAERQGRTLEVEIRRDV